MWRRWVWFCWRRTISRAKMNAVAWYLTDAVVSSNFLKDKVARLWGENKGLLERRRKVEISD